MCIFILIRSSKDVESPLVCVNTMRKCLFYDQTLYVLYIYKVNDE